MADSASGLSVLVILPNGIRTGQHSWDKVVREANRHLVAHALNMCRRDQDLLDSVRGPPRRYRAVITTYAHPCRDHRQWFCRPSWLSFNPSTRTFSGTPTSTNVGTISVRGTANDLGSLAASETFNIGFDDAERRADGGCRYGRRHREGRRSQRLRRRAGHWERVHQRTPIRMPATQRPSPPSASTARPAWRPRYRCRARWSPGD
ncbi:hypothetical protein Sinme_5192 [Sinorhizobium meliloti AK83]|nr:hypothetical protein Sinme_5192 [Sinorhizobium meliloti AK83]SEJ52344.1 Putative Ig domain-containing protein [Sinorhizobium meliloti]